MQGNGDIGAQRPPWFHDDLALATRLAARDDDIEVRRVWRPLLHALRLCDALITREPRTLVEQEHLLDEAGAALRQAARRLPSPGPREGGRTWSQPLDDLRKYGPRQDLVDGLVAALAAELADAWTCPEWLAVTVDDLLAALADYGTSLERLHGEGPLADSDLLPDPYTAAQPGQPAPALWIAGTHAAQRGA